MKVYPLIWKQHPHIPERLDGTVNKSCLFFIEPKGKRKVTYVLQSNPYYNEIFTRANNSKKLFEDSSLEIVQMMAESKLELFISMFMQSDTFEPATLTMLTMYHMQANRDRGIIIADTDALMKLAEGFETRYKETKGKNWENSRTDWETAIINFYNKNKPANWNHIA